jgi:hypothetical protein
MGMSFGCDKCWDTPCVCGWEYRKLNKDKRIKQAAAVLGVSKDLLEDKFGMLVPEKHTMATD